MTPSSPSLLLLLLLLSFLGRPARGEEGEEDTLELVHLLYRHGDRSPIKIYPNDPHNDSSLWPDGLGQLTKKGKAMQYELGQWLRSRYGTFISKTWVPEEVVVLSTDYDRTLMSAACNLASFYYPKEANDRFEVDLAWLPTPIHTMPGYLDKLLAISSACPRLASELEKQFELPFVKNVTLANKNLFQYLSKHSGQEITNITEASYLYDTLHIEKMYNLKLPNWTVNVLPRMKKLNDFSFELVAYSEEMKRIRAGPLIKELRDHMKRKATGDLAKAKLYMYSAHDTTVAALLIGLGVFNGLAPPYATCVLVELHKVKQKHFVKMFLHNDTTMQHPPYPLVLPGCSAICSLEDWLSLTEPVVPENWDAECHNNILGLSFDTLVGNQEKVRPICSDKDSIDRGS